MIVLQFLIATALPVVATAALIHLERHTKFAEVGYWQKQVLYGIVFGLIAIYGTEAGIYTHDATMNVRDAAPLAAGLFFGGPAGIIAGLIGGIERWFAALWGRGMFSRLSCSVATIFAGFMSAVLRRYVFEGKRPSWPIAFVVGFAVETFHLMLIFVTNVRQVTYAFLVARACTIPMVLCNSLSVMLCCLVVSYMSGEGIRAKAELPGISHKVRTGMLGVAIVGFQAMLVALSGLLGNLSDNGALATTTSNVDPRELLLLVVSYMEIILFAALFLANYVLIRNTVVRSVWRINDQLDEICEGDLEVEVDVRDSAEFASLSDGINATVGALRNAIAAESARIERDLETAKAIQESALPRTFPPFPDVDAFDIYASMSAAREVGGDFYDFFMVDDHTLGFLIADVSGKGIPAALFMMEAKAELSHCMKSGVNLSEAVRSANWNICQGNDEAMFVTVWAATLDYTTGELTYVNAGHNPPLLRHDGEWRWLTKRSGLFLGTFESATYRQETLRLEQGDELLLYTDGVNEAFNVDGDEYGNARLEGFVRAHAQLDPRSMVESLRFDVRRWEDGVEQSDDITILCLEYGVPPTISWGLTLPLTEEGLEELLRRLDYQLKEIGCPDLARGELGLAVGELVNDAHNRAQGMDGGPGEIEISYVFIEKTRSLIVSCADRGKPLDMSTYERPAPLEEAGWVTRVGEPLHLAGVNETTYLRDGERNVIIFRKSW